MTKLIRKVPTTRLEKTIRNGHPQARKLVRARVIICLESNVPGAFIVPNGDFSAWCVERQLDVFEDQLLPYNGLEDLWGAAPA